ncbi:hypothetical protein CS0771_48670 [Catellatospora sp. IY07-71]|uniref:hypothetical protein n=1 Tax=Catellatospora sp. IY07-71 TaxID=2728827 RepID=UPI001BB40C1E|nr:hypothetical protein [Catellatospora sp. IY07-71]BCJ75323.1 hypothetical protein CS0771_48670 [Catellatospora sp. IY07-71]
MKPTLRPVAGAGGAPDSIPAHVRSNYVECITLPARAPRRPTPPPAPGSEAGA